MTERILILDDEPDFAAFAGAALAKSGHRVCVLTEPARFPSTLEAFEPTVCVLDIVMPGLDGIEIVNWLANTGFGGRVVLVSGYEPRYMTVAGKIANLKGLDLSDTLRKPVSPERLRQAVEARMA